MLNTIDVIGDKLPLQLELLNAELLTQLLLKAGHMKPAD